MERKYIIVKKSAFTGEMLHYCEQSDFHTCRSSTNGKKVILSYLGSQPECFKGYRELSHDQALAEINSHRWNHKIKPWWKFW